MVTWSNKRPDAELCVMISTESSVWLVHGTAAGPATRAGWSSLRTRDAFQHVGMSAGVLRGHSGIKGVAKRESYVVLHGHHN